MVAKVTDFLRFSGGVKRYHTWPTIQTQTVAEHTWNVLRIYYELFGPPSPEVTVYTLFHDAPELYTGDPPFPIKRDNPDLKAGYDRLDAEFMRNHRIPEIPVTDEDKIRIKVCDLLEMWEFGLVDMKMGNTLATLILTRCEDAAVEIASRLSPAEYEKVRHHIANTGRRLL